MEPKPTRSEIERIAERCRIRRNGCCEWTGAKRGGYGLVACQGRTCSVHRLVFSHYHGRIPKGLFVLHLCANRACVEHLMLGSQRTNFLMMVRQGRQAGGPGHGKRPR